jgi:hypothetical protein
MTDYAGMRLGLRRESHPVGEQRVALAPLPPILMPDPRLHVVKGHNDECGDCVQTMVFNAIQTELAKRGDFTPLPDGATRDLYSIMTGYVRGNQASDKGTLPSDMWAYWKANPIAGFMLESATSIALDQNTIRHTIDARGYVALLMALSVEMQNASTWPAAGAPGTPGTWGDHAGLLAGYINVEDDLDTWGYRQPCTPTFFTGGFAYAAYDLVLRAV